jgi:alanine racemase
LEEAPGDVFILGPVLPAERRFLQSERLAVAVSQIEEARAFQDLGWPIRVHLNIDTGMGRMGCLPEDAAVLAGEIRQMSNLRLEGLCTHFPSADEDAEFTRHQIGIFRSLLQTQPAFSWVHLDNSAGILDFLEWQPDANLVRPGLMLYGLCPMGTHQGDLRPVLSLRSRVTLVRLLPAGHSISYGRTYVTSRPTLVATVGIGYGDGYPRQVSNQGAEVLIRGRRCPILGRVTMDQILVDVSALSGSCIPGEIVTLIGSDGAECILASEVATWAGTISWDILTGLTARVERVMANTNS